MSRKNLTFFKNIKILRKLEIFKIKMAEIKIPPLGESISEATIASIVKKVGSGVKTDELIIELETDKVTLELNAPCDGTIEELTVTEGDTVTVGQAIGKIKEGEVASLTPQAPKKEEKSQESTNFQGLAPSVNIIVNENNINPQNIQGVNSAKQLQKG